MRPTLFAILCCLVLAGCDLIRIGDYDDYGRFDATAEGALDLKMHGTAMLWHDDGDGDPILSLNITTPDFAGFITFVLPDTVSGAQTLGLGPDGTAVTYEVDSRTEQEFSASGGALTFSAAGRDELEGTFTFEGADASAQRVRVEGTFRAIRRRPFGTSA